MPTIRLSVRELVEFLLRTGSIDSRFTGFDRANEGARIHRRLQKAAGEGYAAEVFLTAERTMEGIGFTIEGRADGIFTDEDGTVVIDEIKTTAAPTDAITEDMNPCHWAQGMVYGAICAEQRELETLDVRLTYYQIDTDEIIRYTRHFSAAELDAFLNDLLRQYLPWARRQLDWVEARDRSLGALQFPFPAYRPGQRALAGEVYRACAAGKAEQKGGTRLFCQAPTGIVKTMSALFPALKAMGEGKGEKIFYLTARNTTQAAAEDALARLRAADPALSLRSVTLSAKEKACLCKDAEGRPACLPEACPYANGYYERLKDALADLLDSAVPYDRAALTETARRHRVCPFELGLDLSEWCDVVIGDYNYLFDPTVHLRRFFDAAGDYIFLIDEAHNLPDRARAMYSARFCKSSLTDARRAIGKGKSALKTALTKADKGFLEARRAVTKLAPRRATTAPCWAVPMPGLWHWKARFRPNIWGSTACPGSPLATGTGGPVCRPSQMRWPHWPGPRWATIWPFSPATPICGRCTRTSPPVTRTSGRWPRRVVWTTRPGRPFWNSSAQAPQKRCWASGSWAAFLARAWIWWATDSSGAPSWGWACLR